MSQALSISENFVHSVSANLKTFCQSESSSPNLQFEVFSASIYTGFDKFKEFHTLQFIDYKL